MRDIYVLVATAEMAWVYIYTKKAGRYSKTGKIVITTRVARNLFRINDEQLGV
jgi:hypothetical protein